MVDDRNSAEDDLGRRGERDMQEGVNWRHEEGVECAPLLIGYEVGRCPIEWLRLK
jgi:hypothetical protein